MNAAVAFRTSDHERAGLTSCPFRKPPPNTWPASDRYGRQTRATPAWVPMSPATRKLLATLDVLARPNSERWPGAVPPDPRAFRDARAFVLQLPNALTHLPDIGLAHDGEVNFLWQDDVGLHVDLGFYGSGTFSYFARDQQGKEYLGNEWRAADGLPSDLAALLAR